MKKIPNILAIIPARGGSKGIPRKNLRALNGKPLISYSISTALNSSLITNVYVSSEDEEILSIAEKLGANIHIRNEEIARDVTTLDPVIHSALEYIENHDQKKFEFVITIQPTSPLLKTDSLDSAIQKIIDDESVDTIISGINDTHLTWREENHQFLPNYAERVNRQYLPKVYKETGGFLITRRKCVTPDSRIGKNVVLQELPSDEAIDIDTYADWGICEFYLRRKRILFVVAGNNEIGLGHVFNTLLIANDLVEHEIVFLVDKASRLAYEKIASKNYHVLMQESDDITEDVRRIDPDLVINDRLDTDKYYMSRLRSLGCLVVNFEDLGAGAKEADLTINAIYPESEVIRNHYFGYEYFILRDEFILSDRSVIAPSVRNVLLSFGGVDPNNYTEKVLSAIYEYCQKNKIKINVVCGFGYENISSLEKYKGICVSTNVKNISDYMSRADIIFTSAGRTTYEVASLGRPAIVLCQNEREMTHFFASSKYGFENLGLGYEVENQQIADHFVSICESYEKRKYMSELMLSCDLKQGRGRVIDLIRKVMM